MADVGECTLEFTATDQDGVSDSIEWSVVVSSPTVASLFSPLLMDLDARSGYQGLQERSPQEPFFRCCAPPVRSIAEPCSGIHTVPQFFDSLLPSNPPE
jgi:hypothetical protein